jgi:heme/copper-type cytochrome/quinol oxidase subunit 2
LFAAAAAAVGCLGTEIWFLFCSWCFFLFIFSLFLLGFVMCIFFSSERGKKIGEEEEEEEEEVLVVGSGL